MENKKMEKKNLAVLDRESYKVVDGKVVIESEELANALNSGLDLFCEESVASSLAKGIGCC